jgi:GGDEF domain-containing protein
VGRVGSDEFAALLVDARPQDVAAITGRVQGRLADLARKRELPLEVVCKIGVAFSEAPPETADELLRDANANMQRPKPPA